MRREDDDLPATPQSAGHAVDRVVTSGLADTVGENGYSLCSGPRCEPRRGPVVGGEPPSSEVKRHSSTE